MSSISESLPPDGQLQVMLNELSCTDVDDVYKNNHFTGIKVIFLYLNLPIISFFHSRVVVKMPSKIEQFFVDRKMSQVTSKEEQAMASLFIHMFSYYKKDSEQFKDKTLKSIISYIQSDHDANDPSIFLAFKNRYKMEESYYDAPFESSNLKYVLSPILRFMYPIV